MDEELQCYRCEFYWGSHPKYTNAGDCKCPAPKVFSDAKRKLCYGYALAKDCDTFKERK